MLIAASLIPHHASPEPLAGVVNPFTISHIANAISCIAIGRIKTIIGSEYGVRPNRMETAAANEHAAPKTPHPASHRGMSLD